MLILTINNRYINPFDPKTNSVSCSAAYANDNIQNPELNNAEFVTSENLEI